MKTEDFEPTCAYAQAGVNIDKKKSALKAIKQLVCVATISVVAQGIGADSIFSRVDAQAKKVTEAYAAIHEGFYGVGQERTLLKAALDVRPDGTPNITLDHAAGTAQFTIRLSVDDHAYNAWKADAHRRIDAVGMSVCFSDFEDPEARVIGGKPYRFGANEEAAICRWEKSDAPKKAELVVRVDFVKADGAVAKRYDLPIKAFKRLGFTAYPLPLHHLNRLMDLSGSRFPWGKVEDSYANFTLVGLTDDFLESVTDVRCTVIDDTILVPEREARERAERETRKREAAARIAREKAEAAARIAREKAEAAARIAREKAEAAARIARERAKAEREALKPPLMPPMARVDEMVVAREKESVCILRDEVVAPERAFNQNVNVDLGFWIDPAQPKLKYFRVRVASNADNPLPIVSKDIVFILDASGSVANDRLRSCCKAVSEALCRLNAGDRFNVIAFRDKFTYAFCDAAWNERTDETLKKANEWLEKLSAHGRGGAFSTLRNVLALPRCSARPAVALVMTDGEAASDMSYSTEIISRFSELNGGLISVFMYGVKEPANAFLMDMFTCVNRGGWAYHKGTRRHAAQGVPALLKKFERPVLADVAVIFSSSSRAETCPKLVPNLCADEPIEIYGVCPTDQKELVFQMRGLNALTTYESMFELPFSSAKELNEELRTEWATRRLYEMITEHTCTPNRRLPVDMHKFALDYGIKIPFEEEKK